MTETVQYRFLTRRGTAAALAALNDVPMQGEIYKELDTGREKTGDGVTHYNDLNYTSPGWSDIAGIADGDSLVWDESRGLFVPGSAKLQEYSESEAPYFDTTSEDLEYPEKASVFFQVPIGSDTYLIPAFLLSSIGLLTLTGDFADVNTGVAYTSSIAISGGATPYSNPRVTAGALPSGLNLSISGSNLVLSGTSSDTVGDYSFTAAVDSADGQTATSDQDITLADLPSAIWDATKFPSTVTKTSDTLATRNTGSGYSSFGANVGKSSGKWIFQTKGSNRDYFSGIGFKGANLGPWQNSYFLGNNSVTAGYSVGFENYNGEIYWNEDGTPSHGNTATATGVAAATWLTVAVDLDNWTIKFFNGNTLLNSLSIPASMRGKTYYPSGCLLYGGDTCEINAGQSTIAVPTPIATDGYNAYWK